MGKIDLSQEESDKLLRSPKFVYEGDRILDSYSFNAEDDFDKRIDLCAEDKEHTFLLRIQRSRKNTIKITLHHQDGETRICLLRVDFNGAAHTNPQTASESVPKRFLPFVGRTLSCDHIHYHIEGYRTAAWALPLENDDFSVKSVYGDNFMVTFVKAIECFAKAIHLESKIIIDGHYGDLL